MEADLAAGREAELIGELQQLVAAHPTRERLAGQLMLALYRCGRQAEALEAYSDARRVLVAEIGVEPGPELRRLQDAILRQDASLEPELLVADLPRELDAAAAPPLEGRRAELAWLRERWEQARTGSGVLVTVHGEHGIGKSRLSAELAGEAHAARCRRRLRRGHRPRRRPCSARWSALARQRARPWWSSTTRTAQVTTCAPASSRRRGPSPTFPCWCWCSPATDDARSARASAPRRLAPAAAARCRGRPRDRGALCPGSRRRGRARGVAARRQRRRAPARP